MNEKEIARVVRGCKAEIKVGKDGFTVGFSGESSAVLQALKEKEREVVFALIENCFNTESVLDDKDIALKVGISENDIKKMRSVSRRFQEALRIVILEAVRLWGSIMMGAIFRQGCEGHGE